MLRFYKAIYLSFLLKSVLSVKLSNSLQGSDVLLFLEFIIIVFIFEFIEFIILLYTFLVISFDQYNKCIISLISFSKFSDVLPDFNCARAISNL